MRVTGKTEVTVTTFGYLHPPGAPEAHITLDLRRHFRDPHVSPAMRYLTGRDTEVQQAVLATPGIRQVIEATAETVKAFLSGPSAGPVSVAVGCAGGRHRAAVTGAELGRLLAERGIRAVVEHRDLDKDVVER